MKNNINITGHMFDNHEDWQAWCKEHHLPSSPSAYDDYWETYIVLRGRDNQLVYQPGVLEYIACADAEGVHMDIRKNYRARYIAAFKLPHYDEDGNKLDRFDYDMYTSRKMLTSKLLAKLLKEDVNSTAHRLGLHLERLIKGYKTIQSNAIARQHREYNGYKHSWYQYIPVRSLESLGNAANRFYDELYRFNGRYNDSAKIDLPMAEIDANFELEQETEIHLGEGHELSTKEQDDLLTATAVFGLGKASYESMEGHASRYEQYTFKQRCNVPETGIADTPQGVDDPHQWVEYHKPQAGQTYPVFTTLGRCKVNVNELTADRKVLKCYDYIKTLSDEDRELFYTDYVDERCERHVIRNLDDFIEAHTNSIEFRDYQADCDEAYAENSTLDYINEDDMETYEIPDYDYSSEDEEAAEEYEDELDSEAEEEF